MCFVQMVSTAHCSLMAAFLKMALAVGTLVHFKDREGASDCLGPAHGSMGGHILFMVSSNTVPCLLADQIVN